MRASPWGLRRARAILGAAGLALLLGLSLLLARALSAAHSEQLMRRQALASRLVGELDAQLDLFVAAEQARPFVQWRHEWVPPSPSSPSSPSSNKGSKKKMKAEEGAGEAVPSPLAGLPERPFVLGYFQVEPDGAFASPMLAPGRAPADEAPVLAARVDTLRSLNEDLSPTNQRRTKDEDEDEDEDEEPQPQQQQAPELQQLGNAPQDLQIQRAIDQQAQLRQRAVAQANVVDFEPNIEQLGNFLGDSDDELGRAPPRDDLDLRTTAFTAQGLGDEHLRLVRTVALGEREWVQGLVLERRGLEAWLEAELLDGAGLGEFLELDWSPQGPSDAAAGRFVYALAPPFGELRVAVELGPVRALSDPSARVILALALALALALLAGLIAVERTLAALITRAEERERFVAAVTHELRTPLTSIRMYSEMLEQGMVGDASRRQSYHRTIRQESERLSRLVEQVLTLSRLERARSGEDAQGSGGANTPTRDLGAVFDALLDRLRPQAEARALDLHVELAPDTRTLELPGDPLAQILTNLVDNAIKFSPEGGQAIELRAALRGSQLILSVADRGPGVPPELLPTIFEAFVRAKKEHAEAVRGTGIGLALVRGLSEELGGRALARNREGGGLEVRVELPAPRT